MVLKYSFTYCFYLEDILNKSNIAQIDEEIYTLGGFQNRGG